MTFNPSYAELLGRELQRDRMRDAERERLIRQAVESNPPRGRRLLLIVRSKLQAAWTLVFKKKVYIPLSQFPKNSPSL